LGCRGAASLVERAYGARTCATVLDADSTFSTERAAGRSSSRWCTEPMGRLKRSRCVLRISRAGGSRRSCCSTRASGSDYRFHSTIQPAPSLVAISSSNCAFCRRASARETRRRSGPPAASIRLSHVDPVTGTTRYLRRCSPLMRHTSRHGSSEPVGFRGNGRTFASDGLHLAARGESPAGLLVGTRRGQASRTTTTTHTAVVFSRARLVHL